MSPQGRGFTPPQPGAGPGRGAVATLGEPPTRESVQNRDAGFIALPDAGGTQQDSGFILDPMENAPDQGDFPAHQPSFLERAWDWATIPGPIGEKVGKFVTKNIYPVRRIADKAHEREMYNIGHNNPIRAGLNAFSAGVSEDIANMIEGTFTPLSAGLAALTMGESLGTSLATRGGLTGAVGTGVRTTASGLQKATGVAVGAQSAQQLLEAGVGPRDVAQSVAYGLGLSDTPPKVTVDQLKQSLNAGAMLWTATAGTYAGVKDSLRNAYRKYFKMSDDLASKVADKVIERDAARAKEFQDKQKVKKAASATERVINTRETAAVGKATAEMEAGLQSLREGTDARIANINDAIAQEAVDLGNKIGETEIGKMQTGTQVLQDTVRVLDQEQSRLSAGFEKIGERVKKPVATKTEIQAIIDDTAKEIGVQPGEIPAAAKKALGPPSDMDPREAALSGFGRAPEPRVPLTPEAADAMVREAGGKPMGIQSGLGVKPDLVNFQPGNGGTTLYIPIDQLTPENIRLKMEGKPLKPVDMRGFIGEPPAGILGEDVDFNQATRVKDDLYEAAFASKDGAVRKVLFQAAEKVSDLQEAAAEAMGLGAEYKTLKREYVQFRRGIGGKEIAGWIRANDRMSQQVAAKIAEITPKDGVDYRARISALRSVFKEVGIDVSAFDDLLLEQRKAEQRLAALEKERLAKIRAVEREAKKIAPITVTNAAEETMASARKEAGAARTDLGQRERRALSTAERQGKEALKAAEDAGEIVPGAVTSELEGLPNEELLRQRLQSQFLKARSMGLHTFHNLAMITYGLFDIIQGRSWGYGLATYASVKEFGPLLVKNRQFQDWVIRQAGVEPSNTLMVRKLRLGIEKMYPYLREAARSQVPSAAMSAAQQEREK